MPAAVLEGEDGADLVIPPDIGKLLSINEDEDANEADGEALPVVVAGHNFEEHLAVYCDVKRLGLVHGAGIDLAAMP